MELEKLEIANRLSEQSKKLNTQIAQINEIKAIAMQTTHDVEVRIFGYDFYAPIDLVNEFLRNCENKRFARKELVDLELKEL